MKKEIGLSHCIGWTTDGVLVALAHRGLGLDLLRSERAFGC